MERWATELVRLKDGRLVDATMPSRMDESTLCELRDRISSLRIPEWKVTAGWRDALLLPAACGPKLFMRLVGSDASTSPASANETEIAALACLRDFNRAIGLRFGNSASSDVLKIASCFETNTYRKNVSSLRAHMVTVDEIGRVASYIPPPPKYVPALLKDLYKTLLQPAGDANSSMALALYAMCHFIAIHPLGDGNGRSGRALFIRICTKGGIPVCVSATVIALLHTKYLNLFHSSLMRYCLSGTISAIADLYISVLHEFPDMAVDHLSDDVFAPSINFQANPIERNLYHFRQLYSAVAQRVM